MPVRVLWLLALGAVFPAAGCGGGAGSTPDREDTVAVSFLDSMDDFKEDPRILARYFVKGAAPPRKALARYRGFQFRPEGKPHISGDKATVRVKILDARDKELAVKEWTLAKEGNQWKLEQAPLP